MKTQITLLKFGLILSLLFTTFVAFSSTDPIKKSVTNETEKTIRSYFKFPQVLLPTYETKQLHSNKIEVLFTTDKTGQVNFVMAKTLNKELKQEIEKQFSQLQLNKLKQNVVHTVTLNFKTL
jgi:hypothetical protein